MTVWPGMTIFWIGDLAHQGTVSGHNPDDYPSVRAELEDSDLIPEVRALDFMIGPKFTTDDGLRLVNALVRGVDRQRLYYVIYRSTIWRRATNFQAQAYNGSDNHNSHVHTSGHVDDDANGSDWTSVLALGTGEEEDMTPKQAEQLDNLYKAMFNGGPSCGTVVSPANGRPPSNSLVNKADALLEKKLVPVDIAALVAALTPALRAIVREELNKTKLGE